MSTRHFSPCSAFADEDPGAVASEEALRGRLDVEAECPEVRVEAEGLPYLSSARSICRPSEPWRSHEAFVVGGRR